MEKNKELTEDERKSAGDKIQKITDKYVEEIDNLTKKKEQELLEF